jgi:DNA-binding protein HU-beta
LKRSDLVAKVLSEVGKDDSVQNREEVSKIIMATFSVISDALVSGDSYNHDKFGTFKIVNRAAKKGRNPKTGEEILIPAKAVPKWLPSKQLKDRV